MVMGGAIPVITDQDNHEEQGKSMASGYISSVGNHRGGGCYARMGSDATHGKF